MTIDELYELKSLLGTYFPREWKSRFQHDDHAIAIFIWTRPSWDELDRLVAQIDLFLGSSADESELQRRLMLDLGCHYDPSSEGKTVAEWLRHVADGLQTLPHRWPPLVFDLDVDGQSQWILEAVAHEMVDSFGMPMTEAIGRINRQWAGMNLKDDEVLGHEDERHWARHIYYKRGSFWWLEANPEVEPYP